MIAVPASRNDTLEQLAHGPLDVLVIGGGILGSGAARDAALRGLRVGLIEQADFASGTSSRSSRLLHGGLRYLAQGRIGLVRQAGRERLILRRIAPHLARPLEFIFPIYRGGQWPSWSMGIGVRVYDWICGNRDDERSRRWDVRQTVEALPGIRQDRLEGAVRYFDAITNDSRLVIDTLHSAVNHGALAANYLRFVDARWQSQRRRWTIRVRDTLTQRQFDLDAAVILNATGPWADQLVHSSVRLRRTKGVHLVIDRARLPVEQAVAMAAGRRILFAIPWGARLILGTTDTDFDGDNALVRTEPADVNEILEVVNSAFPSARLVPADVKATWAGVRPLIAGIGRTGEPSDISRAHLLRWSREAWLDVAGGKLTTYRLIAEQAIERVVRFLDRPAPPSESDRIPLLPAPPEGSSIESPAPSLRLVRMFCREEWATRLDDVMIRRTSWRYSRDDADELAEQVSRWMAEELTWSESHREAELARYRALPG